jgi:hypothetical protein
MSIADFDESEKVVSTTDTLGGTQEVCFLFNVEFNQMNKFKI